MDVLEQAKADQVGEHAGAAIGHKGQGNSGHRHHAHSHSNIFVHLEGEPGDYSHDYQLSKEIFGSLGNQERSEEENSKEQENQRATQKSEFFTGNCKNKVSLLFGNETTICLRTIEQALPQKSA